MDQLTILKLWKDYTTPKINFRVSEFVLVYKNIFNFKNFITKIDFDQMNLKYVNKSWVTYHQHYCFKKSNRGRKYYFSSKKFEKDYIDYQNTVLKGRKLAMRTENDERLLFLKGGKVSGGQKIAIKNLLIINDMLRESYEKATQRFKDFVDSRGRKLVQDFKPLLIKIVKDKNEIFK